MSFLYDKNIYTILAAIGASDIIKQSQAINPNLQAYSLAKPLLVNLQRQIDPDNAPKKGTVVGVADGANANPTATVENLRTLQDFIKWAAVSKLTFNNKRFAWINDEVTPAIMQIAWNFTKLPDDRGNRNSLNQPNTEQIFALKPELSEYLTSLRDDAIKNNKDGSTKVLQVMLKSLIEQLNGYLRAAGQEELDAKPANQSGKSDKIDLDPAAIIDGLPFSTLELDKWNDGLDDHPNFFKSGVHLTVKDVSDQGSFINWLKALKVKTKVTEANSEALGIPSGNDVILSVIGSGIKSDPCLAVHILYKRAQYLNNIAVSDDKIRPNYSKMTALYLKAVQEYGSQLTGADGKSCSVTSPSGSDISTNQKSNQTPATTTVDSSNITDDVASLIKQAVDKLPLKINLIDNQDILTWLGYIEKVMQRETSIFRASIVTALSAADKMSSQPGSCDLGLPAQQIKYGLISPQRQFCNYLDQYSVAVTSVKKLISQFQNRFGTYLKTRQDLWQQVVAQVGLTESDSYSIATRNIQRLEYLKHSGGCPSI